MQGTSSKVAGHWEWGSLWYGFLKHCRRIKELAFSILVDEVEKEDLLMVSLEWMMQLWVG
jgi:hypothetical protein